MVKGKKTNIDLQNTTQIEQHEPHKTKRGDSSCSTSSTRRVTPVPQIICL
jgi:hypothetical protein